MEFNRLPGIKPWNIATLLIITLIIAWFLARHRPPTYRPITLGVSAYVLLSIWMGVSVFWAPDLELAAGVALAQIATATALILVLVAAFPAHRSGPRRFARALTNYTAFYCVVSILLYIYGFLTFPDYPTIFGLGDTLGFRFDRARALRLVGFAENPNFLAVYLVLPLLLLLSTAHSVADWLKTAIIVAALMLTMSRGVVIALLAGALVGLPIDLLTSHGANMRYWKRVGTAVMAASATGAGAVLLSETLREWVQSRILTAAPSERISIWESAVASIDNPLLGDGLQAIMANISQFSHNTFLDVLLEMGILGLVLWTIVALFIAIRLFSHSREQFTTATGHAFLSLFFAGITHSLLYNPIYALGIAFAILLTTQRSHQLHGATP